MIERFSEQGAEDIYHGLDSRAARRTIPKSLWTIAQRKLSYLNAAHSSEDLRAPPGNRLEQLRGDLSGFWSIRLNDKYRVIFRFSAGRATDVAIVDYH